MPMEWLARGSKLACVQEQGKGGDIESMVRHCSIGLLVGGRHVNQEHASIPTLGSERDYLGRATGLAGQSA